MTKKKVFWTPEELQAVVAELRCAGVTPETRPMGAAIGKAQGRMLPPSRHRTISSRCLEDVRAALRPTPAVDPAPEPVRGPEAKGAVIKVPPTPTPMAQPLDEVARLLGRRIARVLMDALREEISEQVDALSHGLIETWVEQAVKPTATAKIPRKPTVLIAGLLPMQAGLISQEFGHRFDLRFFEAGGSLQKLKSMSHVDHAFSFTSKIGHDVEAAMQSKGTPVLRCPGGMTMLRQKLTELGTA
jgi:hypothetical protein